MTTIEICYVQAKSMNTGIRKRAYKYRTSRSSRAVNCPGISADVICIDGSQAEISVLAYGVRAGKIDGLGVDHNLLDNRIGTTAIINNEGYIVSAICICMRQ